MGIQLIVQVGAHDGERTLVVAHGWFFAHNLVALAHDVSSVPIVLPIGSVHGQGMVQVWEREAFSCMFFRMKLYF